MTRARPTQRRRWLFTALAIALVPISGHFLGFFEKPYVPTALSSNLEALRAPDGLFFHPALFDQKLPGLADTAYGDQVIKLTGQQPQARWTDTGNADLVRREVVGSSVWARWYAYQIEDATGSAAPETNYRDLMRSYHDDGYLQDDSLPASDNAANLAATAAGLEVVQARGVKVTDYQRRRISGWLTTRAASLANPYQACAVLRSARAAGLSVPEQVSNYATTWWGKNSSFTGLRTQEAILDAFGYACLAKDGGGTPEASSTIRNLLGPELARSQDAFNSYHLARAWIDLGGAPESLRPLADALTQRRLPSGLLSAQVSKVGTLDTAYAVTQIRALTGTPGDDLLLANGTQQFVAQNRQRLGATSLAKAALILKSSGHPDSRLAQAALTELRQQAPGVVTRDNVSAWANQQRLAVQLNPDQRPITVVPWRTTTKEDRFLAWELLATVTGNQRPAVPGDLTAQLDQIPQVLFTEAATLSMRELRAGVQALRNFDRADQVPARQVADALGGLKGCAGLPELFRGDRGTSTCDAEATADGYGLVADASS